MKPKTLSERMQAAEARILYLYNDIDSINRRASATHARIDDAEKTAKAAIMVAAVAIVGLVLLVLLR